MDTFWCGCSPRIRRNDMGERLQGMVECLQITHVHTPVYSISEVYTLWRRYNIVKTCCWTCYFSNNLKRGIIIYELKSPYINELKFKRTYWCRVGESCYEHTSVSSGGLSTIPKTYWFSSAAFILRRFLKSYVKRYKEHGRKDWLFHRLKQKSLDINWISFFYGLTVRVWSLKKLSKWYW